MELAPKYIENESQPTIYKEYRHNIEIEFLFLRISSDVDALRSGFKHVIVDEREKSIARS